MWLQYLFNPAKPDMSTFRCRFCNSYAKQKSAANHLPVLSSEDGFFVKNYKIMFEKISTHSTSAMHKKAVISLKESYLDKL